MIHLKPLPGTPYYREGSFDEILQTAVDSEGALDAAGAQGCLVQTVDRVYGVEDEADPARTAAMSVVVQAIRKRVRADFLVGVQFMRNAVKPSLAVAKVCGGNFVRVGVFVGALLTECGWVSAQPLANMEIVRQVES